MSKHKAEISWQRQTETFEYDVFNREHEWTFDNGVTVEASSAPDYLGKSGVDPEEALTACVSACHMLTFLALASRKRYVVDVYNDSPVGTLEKNEEGKMMVTTIELNPTVQFSGDTIPTQEQLKEMHDKAHQHCFIANSIKSEVKVIL